MRVHRSALVSILLAAAATTQGPSTWTDYRGPNRDGQAPGAEIPLEWSEDLNVRWKTPVRGRGWSSPVVRDGTIWMTTAPPSGVKLGVVAIDLETGKIRLQRVVFAIDAPESINKLNSYASPTPAVGPERVYVHFGTYGTAALDPETGASIWERDDIHCDHMEGPGSSPLLVGDALFLTMDGGDVQYVIALDAATGETRWKTDRSEELTELVADLRKGYSTPMLAEIDGETRLLSSGARATYAYDLATGEEVWKVRHVGFSMSSRPVIHDGLVILNTGYMRPELVAVRLTGRGDVTDDAIAWTYRRGIPTMPSPVLVDGKIFLVSNGGVASCLDATTGENLWRERIGGEHCASPLGADGRIYFFDREGQSVVVRAVEEFERLAENRLDDGFMASPAVIGNALILRTQSHVYRIEADD